MNGEHIHFVTGKLAEPSLRRVVGDVSATVGFDYTIDVLGISVAALLTPEWIARHVTRRESATRALLPGYCGGDLTPVCEALGIPVARGPKDLRDLPRYFGETAARRDTYGAWDIEILAEINHVPRMTVDAVLREADRLRAAGADVIDVGCDPEGVYAGVGEVVRALKGEGHRVSIDSMAVAEVEAAVDAGAELVLSVNATNRQRASDWDCEVVVVPDTSGSLEGMAETVAALDADGVRYRLDGVLDPIGFGFAASLGRFLEIRRRWPTAEIMMGVGNLTELTEVDSAGVNALLIGFCQEIGVRSILTTEVINWARTSVQECDIARRLMHYAVHERALPKHVDSRLMMLRDGSTPVFTEDELAEMVAGIRDHNLRVVSDGRQMHVLSADLHVTGDDAFEVLKEVERHRPGYLDSSHAFYLGYEMAKATTAITLGKRYEQDTALDWGFLTRDEVSHRSRPGEVGHFAANDDNDSGGVRDNA